MARRFFDRSFWELPARREFRLRIFDGKHEVLTKYEIKRVLDLESPALEAILAGVLAAAAEQAGVLEDEPMPHPRLEVHCVQSGRKVKDYLPGLGGLL